MPRRPQTVWRTVPAKDVINQFPGIGEHGVVIASGAVPFEHGVFGMVPIPAFSMPETLADLKDFFRALRQQFFVVQLRRSAQPAVARRFGIDMQFHARRFHPDRGFDFDKSLGMKKRPDALHQGVARFQFFDRDHQAFETRSAYSPVRVSIRTMSPSLMKIGT